MALQSTGDRNRVLAPAALLTALVVFALAVLSRVGGLDRPPFFDELYHLMAGLSWLETGEFRIAEGTYRRAPLYSLITAGLLGLGDGSVALVRFSSTLLGAGLILVLYLWVRSFAGPVAAGLAAAAAIFWPEGIVVSQSVRFYALAGFLFVAGAIAVFVAVERPLSVAARVVLLAVAAAAFWLAAEFTPVILVGLCGLSVWLGLFVIVPALWTRPRGLWMIAGLAALGLAGLAGLWAGGVLAEIWRDFRFAPDWVAEHRNNERFYNDMLLDDYGLLWLLTPVAALVALARQPREALFCLTLFGIALAIHSFAGMKVPRYVYHLLPFLFAIWGMAAGAVAHQAVRLLRETGTDAAAAVHARLAVAPLGLALGAVAALFALQSAAALPEAAKRMLGQFRLADAADWALAAPDIRPLLDEVEVVATPREPYVLWHIGRVDVIADASRLSEVHGAVEFDPDPRTGAPMIGSAEALAAVVGCSRSGIFVAPVEMRPVNAAILAGLESLPATRLSQVEMPPRSGIEVIRWDTDRTVDTAACAPVRAALSDGS
ncbi:MAG: hypothetical protein QNJ13_17390 [Paracoccaceae bacterium]|nr:hypothetical protein [Paracoccaceae bacterium]